MARSKNFLDDDRITGKVSVPAARLIRQASLDTGLTLGTIMDRLILGHLADLVAVEGIEESRPVLPPSPRPANQLHHPGSSLVPKVSTIPSTPKPKRAASPGRGVNAKERADAKFAADAAASTATHWTPVGLQAALEEVGMKRKQLQEALGHSNIDMWWSPGRGKDPRVPVRYWEHIDRILKEAGLKG